ncbi:hypothetical protein N7540_000173 [Penicillium herquei]|nr:hypothetical protein N7540_000173 [Penicillium herquei]
MNPVEFTCRSNEARRLGIQFLDPNEVSRRPTPHEERFAHIQELGHKICDSFFATIPKDASTKPWRMELPRRVERLTSLADRCYREDSGNEFGWRFKVENEIMHRFTVEVACVDGGINILFSDRAEARIKHDPPIQISLDPPKFKNSERVDRIYGLRHTENFRLLLDSSDKRYIETTNISLRESITCSPLSSGGGEPLLFPFIIIEAKSSKGRSRAETHMQSAFCIQRLLKIQRDLFDATGDEGIQWEAEQLIWYIATRGEQWDLYAGFVDIDQSIMRYPVVELWSGNIRHRDAALQLLLIIDYIFDWARDIYRKAILDQLGILSIETLGEADPDLFSTVSRQMSHISSQNGISSYSQEFSKCRSFSQRSEGEFDFLNIHLPEGVIRDAAEIESRYMLIRITENNVDEFLSYFHSQADAKAWASAAINCLKGSWKLSPETLLSMESTWTETHRQPHEDCQYQQSFYTSITMSLFMGDDWTPVRQIACLAVSEGAFNNLANECGCTASTFGYDANPKVEISSIESLLQRTLNQSIMDNLTAAVSMLCLSSCFYKRDRRIDDHLRVCQSGGMSAGFRIDRSPRTAQLVHYVYANHRFGHETLSSSYFSSSRIKTKNNIQYRGRTVEMWPQLPRLVLESRQQGVLVDGASSNTSLPSRGLFLFSQFSDYRSLSRLVGGVLQEGIYFKTLQLGSNFLSPENFGYLNRPVKLNQEWRDQVPPDFSTRWRQKLEDTIAMQDYHEGAAFSCPIVLSSDEETETEQ